MTHYPSAFSAAGSTFFGRVALYIFATIGRAGQALRNRAEVRKLAELDDYLLKDLGLSRSEVEGALQEPLFKTSSNLSLRSAERAMGAGRLVHQSRSYRQTVPSLMDAVRRA